MAKGNGKYDKNEGLSEEQRLAKAKSEQEYRESVIRLQTNLRPFLEEYGQLVEKYGIKHLAQIEYTPDGIRPVLVQRECRKEVEKVIAERSKVNKISEGGIVKN